MKIDIKLLYPTYGDCHNISYDTVPLHHHFIFMDKQICIDNKRGKFAVKVFGWKPKFYNGLNLRFDTWYSVAEYDHTDIDSAQRLFKELVLELIGSPEWLYESSFKII